MTNMSPAMVYDGLEWRDHSGVRHRTDGPAYINVNGHHEWYVNGVCITQQVTQWQLSHNISWPWDESTQAVFTLTWS